MSDEPVYARPLYKVKLVVRHQSGGETIGGYTQELDMTAPPCVGMRFKQGIITQLWETEAGELDPAVEDVVYDIDEEAIICLFTVSHALKSSFWKELPTKGIAGRCAEFLYFRD